MANRISRIPAHASISSTPKSSSKSSKAAPHEPRVLRLQAVGFKPHPLPTQRSGADDEHESKESVQQFSFKVLADLSLKEELGNDILRENGWTRVNPRGRKLVGPVMDAIETTWKECPTEFYRINRGIVLTAESVTWDKAAKMAEIVFTDQERHGVLDGAHTLAKLVDDLIPATYSNDEHSEEEQDAEADDEEPSPSSELTSDRYITCEVWVGLDKHEVARLSAGRNTSRGVPSFAISNLRGDFDIVKPVLEKANPVFFNKIAFKPNEHVESLDDDVDHNYKPVSILEILQLMMCMDVTNYSETDQPIEAYKNQAYIPKFWDKNNERNRIAEYIKMLPVLADLLELYDTVRKVVPDVYDSRTTLNKLPRRWNKVLARKKGQPLENIKRESLYYLDPTGEIKTYRAPKDLFYPIVCSFRACLRANGNGYEWIGGKKPTAWAQSVFRDACLCLALTIASLAKKSDSLHAVGRDAAVWAACYNALNRFLFEYGIKTRRS